MIVSIVKPSTAYIFVFLLNWTNLLVAHGDLHERILVVTKEIKADPDNAFLYLKRGELYFQHEEYKKALKDYLKCKSLDYSVNRLEFNLANTYHRLNKPDKSLMILNSILDDDPFHVKSYRLKASILLGQMKFKESASTYDRVIEHANKTLPENYIESSVAWENVFSEEGKCRSMDIILAGIETLGPLRIFYDRLIYLNKKYNEWHRVVDYQTILISQSQRKERPYFNRAMTYMDLKQTEYAIDDLKAARNSIILLNNRLRNQKNIKELYSKISHYLELLETKQTHE